MVLAARENGYPGEAEPAARSAAAGYRQAMGQFAQSGALDLWYAQLTLSKLQDAAPTKVVRKRLSKGAAKARGRTSRKALGKLAETVDGRLRIRSQPPLLVPLGDIAEDVDPDHLRKEVKSSFRAYGDSMQEDRRHLVHRFELVDIALKVVGVGSVGTRCFVVLLKGLDQGEPLFLQIKEADRAVVEAHLPPSVYDHHGQRVVVGQRLMQATSDSFLGWSQTGDSHQYYWRQFHDLKGSADTTTMNPSQLSRYGAVCGWTLAHAHARSGDGIAISAYLGKGSSMDKALGRFALTYADQNDRDYQAFTQAIDDGRIQATEG